jgi:hypothetical protein
MRKDKNKALLLTIILIASAIIQPVKPARVSAVEAMTSITLRSTATVTAGMQQIIDGSLTLNGFISNIEGATVKIAGNFDVGKDVLSIDTTGAPSLTASYDSSGGILTISGSASSSTYQTVLRTVKFYTTGSSTSRNIVISVNKAASTAQYNSLTGHYYEFITSRGITWTDAKIAAETREIAGEKGYLATVTTAQENEFLTTACQGYGWLGGSDAGHEGQWYWVTGPEGAANNGNGTKFVTQRASGGGVASTESGMYQNFRTSPVEPNNDAAGGENYLHMLSGADNGKWNDFPNYVSYIDGYLVEYGMGSMDNLGANPPISVSASITLTVTQNQPVASNVRITGTAKVGLVLAGGYDYSDINGDLEGASTFQWYRSENAAGAGRTVIVGATGLTYTLQTADLGKYISFEVTPKALTGILTGTAVESARTTAVLPAEAAPVASNVRITGTAKVGLTLTGAYDYSDINGDLQGTSTFQWYRSENAAGAGRTVIVGATGLTYTLQTADLGKYISFEVTPKALTGILTGTAVESARTTAVLPAEAAPVASNVRITGTAKVGLTLTGAYDYSDINGDLQGTSTFQWYRSENAAGAGRTVIAGATGLTYSLQEADLDKYISFEVTPKALAGILTGIALESARTTAVLPAEAAPVASNIRITGTTKVGLTLTGAYDYSDINGDLEGTSIFQWYRANSTSGDGRIAITGATGLTYTLQEADLGKCISFEVTPKALTGVLTGTAAESVKTAAVLPAEAAPAASNVRITGTAKVGLTLTGSYDYSDINGDLEGTSTFQWYRADSASGDGRIAIAGATGLTYTLQEADLGKYISFEVIPKALTGILTGISAESARTAAVLPAEAAPIASNVRITGTTKVGLTLTGAYDYSDINGDLEGTSMFQWYRSDSTSGDGKTAITGATGLNYTLQEADLGKYISFEVTPKALTGILTGTAVESARTTVVLPAEAAPVASNVRITGTAKVGLTLTGGYDYSDINGDSEGTSTFQWYHADSASGDGRIAITGATGLTYTLQEADLGKYISFEVIPKALTGILTGTSAESARTAAVLPAEAAPIASNVRITGTAKVGLTLTGGYDYSDINGDLEGISIFQWYRSDNSLGIGKVAITGETGLTYTLQASDLDKYISFEVTPKALTGILTGTAVESARTVAVLPAEAAPMASNVRITGTAKVGLTLTGAYDYSDINEDLQGTSTFQWYRANSISGDGKTVITGATELTYTLQEVDLGKYISFEVTPIAQTGSVTGAAIECVLTTAVLPAEAAPIVSNVRITGIAKVGLTLTGAYDYSDINGDMEGTSMFQWYRSDSTSGTGKAAITGETGLSYMLQGEDLGKYISFKVTPVAQSGSVTGAAIECTLTTAVLPAEAAPVASNVRITGTTKVGLILTGGYDYSDINGDMEGTSMFQWYRSDNTSGTGKAAIAGATGLTYTLKEMDLGKYISFEVTPIAQTGSITGAAAKYTLTSAVLPAESIPENTPPTAINATILGMAKQGEQLVGSYQYNDADGDPEGSSVFAWYRSNDTAGTGKAPIPGSTGISYVLQAEDVGKYISFKVTPVAQTGSVTGAAIECILTAAVLPAGSVPENTPPTAANVTILGIAKQGEQLVGSYQYSDADGDPEGSSIFAWYRSKDAAGTGKTFIPGSTGVSYVLQAEDVGQYISFKVTPVAQTGSVTGAAIECILTAAVLPAGAIPENTPPIAVNVAITGVAKAGELLTGGYRYIDTDGDPEGSSLYRWYRSNDASGNGKTVIGGADTISYILTLEDIGKYISFEVTPVAVTGSAIGITVESNRTAAVIPAVIEPVNTAPTANNVSIYGTAMVGQVLTGSYSYYDAESDIQTGSLYKWYRSDDSSGTGKAVIAGAAGLYYLLGQADLGKYISFEVTPVALTGIQFGTPTESIRIGAIAPPAVIPSNPTPTPAPEEQQEEITVDIKKGDSEEAAARIVVRRTTNADGTKTDTVVYDEAKALEAIVKLKEEGFDLARIVVPDENDEVSETNIKIQSKALDIMVEGNINLEIDTENVKINIPKESLREFSEESPDDLYFNLVPVKKEEEKEQIVERARNGMLIMGITEGTLLSVIGRPMVIETNMPSAAVDITLPLNDIVIPTDEKEREEFLNKLGVYVEHSDGDKELIKGEIVEFKDGVYGIKFRIMKFSTFTILRLDKAAEKSRECEILTVKSPAKAKLEGTRLSLTVQYETTNITVKVTVSENASWTLYSDSACKKAIKDNRLQLKIGSNKAYLKVTAEDGTSTRVYTIAVTRDKKPEVPKKVVFIATNADFSDAYAGEVLAKQLGGRVIQIGYADKDIQNIVKFITAHLTVKDDIYILGLDKAVKYDLEKILKEKGYKNIIRIGGEDKYETAKKITEHLKPQKGTRVVIMSGEKQPNDGDSIKSACAAKGYPILYTKKDTLTDYTIKALKDLEPSEIYIVGDKSQISDKVIKELERVLQIKGSKIKRVKSGGDVI